MSDTSDRRPDAGQTWNAATYARNGRFVADLALPVVALLAPRAHETILDLGCGDGTLTLEIANSGARAIGCDASEAFVDAARARGIDARHIDGHALAFAGEFDAVFSNAALHWMLRPTDVIAGVRRALRPGGRFVGEFGGHGNIAAIVTALHAVLERRGVATEALRPWFFPTPSQYAELLEAGGFRVDEIALIPRPTPLATGMDAWLATFGQPYLSALPKNEREPARADALRLLASALRDSRGAWTADYVRLRFSATLPA
ncbi:MAG: class I SAM-dependent methyltransferase [Vulcanimicrobiaceae bacterium]